MNDTFSDMLSCSATVQTFVFFLQLLILTLYQYMFSYLKEKYRFVVTLIYICGEANATQSDLH